MYTYNLKQVKEDGSETNSVITSSELSTLVVEKIGPAIIAVEFFHDLMNDGIAHIEGTDKVMYIVYV